MQLPKLCFPAFFKSLKSASFSPHQLSTGFSFQPFFSFCQNINNRKSQSNFTSEIHHQSHQDFHHQPKEHLDFQAYLSEKKMKRLPEMARPKVPFPAFYYEGIRKMLNCFEKYEMYVNENIFERFLNKQPLLPHEKEFGAVSLFFKTNEITQGHRNIAHGGLIATIMDHLLGTLSAMVGDGSQVATVSLNLIYKKPVHVGKEYLLEVHFEKLEKEKKIFIKGRILNDKNEDCIEASSVFLKVDWKNKN